MPSGMVQGIVAEVKDLARSSAHAKRVMDATVERYGALEDLLSALEWPTPDTAKLLWVTKDGRLEEVVKNVMPGQLITALERGFLPITLARYRKENPVPQFVAGVDVRSNTGERAVVPEPTDTPTTRPTDAELYCEPCDRLFSTLGGIRRHITYRSHINRVAELNGKK